MQSGALLTGWLVELKLSSRQACGERPQQQQCSLSLFAAEFDLPAIQDFFKNSIDYVSLSAYVPQATVDFQVGRCCRHVCLLRCQRGSSGGGTASAGLQQ